MSTKFEVAMRLVEQMSRSMRTSHRKLSRYRRAIEEYKDTTIHAQTETRRLRLYLEETEKCHQDLLKTTLATIAEQEKEIESLKSSQADAQMLRFQLEQTQKSHRDLFKSHADTLAAIAEKEKEIVSMRDVVERLCETVTVARGTRQKSDVWFAHFLGLTGVDFHNKSSANDEAAAVRNEIRRIVSEGRATRLDNESGRQQIADDLATALADRDAARAEQDDAIEKLGRAMLSRKEASERIHELEQERAAVVDHICEAVTIKGYGLDDQVWIGGLRVITVDDAKSFVQDIRDEIRKAAKG